MTVVAFPFKDEDINVVGANLRTAARHRAVRQVWAIAAGEGDFAEDVFGVAEEIWKSESKPVVVMMQQRIGRYRAGKGDGMNTGIRAAAESGVDRLHFYDADILNFDASWIDGAEAAADRGFGVVRHRFPRAATDAMITWMITRPSLAILFPGTVLPRLGQPLGGEMMLTRPVIESLAADTFVSDRSDWGIDTILTHATTTIGVPLFEHHVADGKRHALYGSLDELRDMLVECLDAARSLKGRPSPPDQLRFDRDPPGPVPRDLKQVVAYDMASTLPLLTAPMTTEERALAANLPGEVADLLDIDGSEPAHGFLDEALWGRALRHLLDSFDLGSKGWRDLAFRLWLHRVVAYTHHQVPLGYDRAIEYLEGTIRLYESTAG